MSKLRAMDTETLQKRIKELETQVKKGLILRKVLKGIFITPMAFAFPFLIESNNALEKSISDVVKFSLLVAKIALICYWVFIYDYKIIAYCYAYTAIGVYAYAGIVSGVGYLFNIKFTFLGKLDR